MNPQYDVIEQLYRLDLDASLVTQDQRAAQKELIELEKRSKTSEEVLIKSRNEMNFNEAELRRLYKKLDELEDKKIDRQSRLHTAKNDDDHRTFKREADNVERDFRETQKRVEEVESRIEHSKQRFLKAEEDLQTSVAASLEEKQKAMVAENNSRDKLADIQNVRNNHLARLEDRVAQHYTRVAKITRTPNGPICRVVETACGNCRIGLSPQILNNIARGNSVEFCPNCSHLLLPTSKE